MARELSRYQLFRSVVVRFPGLFVLAGQLDEKFQGAISLASVVSGFHPQVLLRCPRSYRLDQGVLRRISVLPVR